MIRETNSARETWELGREWGSRAKAGEIYCLDGDLGAGKTVFAQGFAAGLGISGTVNSPTFTILKVYETGRLPLYHFDVYRVADAEEMEEIGCEEYLCGEGVSLIEWACLVPEIIPDTAVRLTIEREDEKGPNYRKITAEGVGER